MFRKLLPFGFLLAFACIAHAQSAAPITAVMLYPGSATVTRTARVEAGATRLVIPDLTTQFAAQSLRVEADPGIRIGQIVTQDAARTESANAAQAALEARIQALQDQSAALEAQAGAADIVTGYLQRAGDTGGEHPRVAVDPRTLTATVAALSQAAGDALAKKHQVAMQQHEIQLKVDALERDLDRLRSQSRDARTLTINLGAERAGTVRISYQLNSAGWRPAYRAELDSASGSLLLDRVAQVSQKTGEDWRGVKLLLSTAQPRQGAYAPTPQPWLLGYVPPRPPGEAPRRYPYPMAAPAPAPASATPVERVDGEGVYRPPTFQTDGTFATEFTVTAPVNLPSDGREVLLPLGRDTLVAKQQVQVSPRLSTAATVTADVEKPAGVWPPGNLQLYRDGSYVGARPWTPDAGEKWQLSFGSDDLLQVRLAPVKGDTGSAGVFEKRSVRRIADRITLHSAHTTPVEVIVLDAAPVSTSDEVKVQSSFTPQPTIEGWEERRGVNAWVRTLPPQSTATIDVAYTIEYPKEGTVTGLR